LRLLSAALVALVVTVPIIGAVALYRCYNNSPSPAWSAPHLVAVGAIMLVALTGALLLGESGGAD
jgi:hypothetical protein